MQNRDTRRAALHRRDTRRPLSFAEVAPGPRDAQMSGGEFWGAEAAYAVSAHIQTALIALARLVVSGKGLKP